MRKVAMILFVLLFPAYLFAATVQLPETGQVTCTDDTGAVVDCAGTGQDGDILAGAAWPDPRFTDNNDGTVTDILTGLIWLKNANCFSYQDWSAALNLVSTLANGQCQLADGSVAGDWRLPNYNELKSLVNREEDNSAVWLTAQGFLGTRSADYFSSSTYASDTTGAWTVLMSSGVTRMLPKTTGNLVWPVRTGSAGVVMLPQTGQLTSYAPGDDGEVQNGEAWPSQRFTNNMDGTITDNLTGLTWLQDADCITGSWTEMLDFTNNLADGACGLDDGSVAGDWRLPNVNELNSLNNIEELDLGVWLASQGFTNLVDLMYWSSDSHAYNPISAWGLLLPVGEDRYDGKDSNVNILPVKGGLTSQLTVEKIGAGNGTITPDSGALTFVGPTGTENYPEDTVVTLTVTPDMDSVFVGWSGACTGTGDCELVMGANQTVSAAFELLPPVQIGVFRSGTWYLDANNNGAWDPGADTVYADFGMAGDLPVVGEWNGALSPQVGVFRDGMWYLDVNNNGAWDPGTDSVYANFGMAGDLPVAGEWSAGSSQVGVFRDGTWYLDANGNGAWDPDTDTVYANFGMVGDLPVVGDWNGDGIASEIGVFRNGTWYLDANNNGAWDPDTDTVYANFGMGGDLPVVGDWDGDGIASEIGVFRNGTWYLDANDNGAWDPDTDTVYANFGQAGDIPVIGIWPAAP
jgi:hypothetical protein